LMTERNRAQHAEATLAIVSEERTMLRGQLARLEDQMRSAEFRSMEAEKDNGELLNAIDASRERGAKAISPVAASALSEQERNLIGSRLKQEANAMHAERMKQSARLNEELSSLKPTAKFLRLIGESEAEIARGEFNGARVWFDRAMDLKPDDQPITDRIMALRHVIEQQSGRMEIPWVSDGRTDLRVFSPGRSVILVFNPTLGGTLKLPPGDYMAIGRRAGFQDVTTTLRVRNGEPPPTLNLACSTPASQ
jgi:hypothetical protein